MKSAGYRNNTYTAYNITQHNNKYNKQYLEHH